MCAGKYSARAPAGTRSPESANSAIAMAFANSKKGRCADVTLGNHSTATKPGHTRRPQTSSAASAMPAAGHAGAFCSGEKEASRLAAIATAAYTTVTNNVRRGVVDAT